MSSQEKTKTNFKISTQPHSTHKDSVHHYSSREQELSKEPSNKDPNLSPRVEVHRRDTSPFKTKVGFSDIEDSSREHRVVTTARSLVDDSTMYQDIENNVGIPLKLNLEVNQKIREMQKEIKKKTRKIID